MNEFTSRVAVVTGAANGIGFALAEKFGFEGMTVILVDIEPDELDRAVTTLESKGYNASGVVTDVSKEDQVQALAEATLERHGAVHILCNNAGVASVNGNLWDCPSKDFEWVFGVNLWGVIWGIRTFVPIMLAQESDCHIVNTASMAGLLPGGGIYGIAKHGVCSLSESLYESFARSGAKIGVSVLLPGLTDTNLWDSLRHRPHDLADPESVSLQVHEEERAAVEARGRSALRVGQAPSLLAEKTLDCIRTRRFWIVPNERYQQPVLARAVGVFRGENPLTVRDAMAGFGQLEEGW